MEEINRIDFLFDDLLFQTLKGNITHEQIERGVRFEQFEQVAEWKLKYGYKFNIYSNDHLIQNKPHFHFDNSADKIFCKVDFEGNILECKFSNTISTKILKELKYFLSKDFNRQLIIKMWNEKNPTLQFNEFAFNSK